MSTTTSSPDSTQKRTHLAARGLAVAGMAVLAWLEIQRRYRLGVVIDAIDLLVFLTAIFFSPIYTYESFYVSPGEPHWKAFWINLLFVLLLYASLAASLTVGALHIRK